MDDARFPKIIYFLMLVQAFCSGCDSIRCCRKEWHRISATTARRTAGSPRTDFSRHAAGGGLNVWRLFPCAAPHCRSPGRRINLPHKDYWLAPARREETFRFIAAQMAWSAAPSCSFSFSPPFSLFGQPFAGQPFRQRHHDQALAVFLFVTVLWIVHFLRHFYRLPADASSRP